MRWTPVPLAGGAYSDDAKPWTCQDTVNYLPVPAERPGTRSPSILRSAPGFTTFCASMQEAPVRGLHNVEGLLLAVTGSKLYRIGTDGAATEIGTIPGVQRVSMAHNKITDGFEVMVANGQSGYVYNTVSGTLTQVTDDAFPGMKVCDFVDGYIAGVEPFGRYWFHSNLNAATDYNALDRYSAESEPDKIVSLIVSHREVMVLGERTTQFYRNTGAATGTFQNYNGTEQEVGCASPHAVARLDNSVYWLANDGTVRRLEGHAAVRISTGPLEQAISRCNASNAFAFTFEDRGHKVFYLTLPDGQTWGYDVWSREWHRRRSKDLDRWRLSALVRWNGAWIGGDFSNGRLYQLDWAVQSEAGEEMEKRRITPVLHDNQNRVTVNAVEIVVDTGLPEGGNSLLDPLTISGNLPDGLVGESVSGAYAASGGVLPHGEFSVASGTFPPGLTLNSDGTYSGTYATEGSYTWEVQVVDASGGIARLADSAEVISFAVFASVATGTGAVYESQDILTWSTIDQVDTGLGEYPKLLESYNGLVFAVTGGAGRVSSDGGKTWESCTGIPSQDPRAMAFIEGLGYLLVVSSGTNAYLSADGKAFTPYAIDTTARTWFCIAVNGDKVVIGATSGTARVSLDGGETFQTIDISSGVSGGVLGAVPSGSGFVAITSDTSNAIHATADGLNWSTVTHPAFSTRGVALAKSGSRIVAISTGGQAIVSEDSGATWGAGATASNASTLSARPLIATRGHFLMCGMSGSVYETESGLSWTQLVVLGDSDVVAMCAVSSPT